MGTSTAHVTQVVVDTKGTILGILIPADPLVDSIDVSLQKARTSAFFDSKESGRKKLPPRLIQRQIFRFFAKFINSPVSRD